MALAIPDAMRAMQLAAPAPVAEAPLKLVELPVPQAGPGEVLLKVRACGVCRTDLHILEGELPPHRSPVVPGHQIVAGSIGSNTSASMCGGGAVRFGGGMSSPCLKKCKPDSRNNSASLDDKATKLYNGIGVADDCPITPEVVQ